MRLKLRSFVLLLPALLLSACSDPPSAEPSPDDDEVEVETQRQPLAEGRTVRWASCVNNSTCTGVVEKDFDFSAARTLLLQLCARTPPAQYPTGATWSAQSPVGLKGQCGGARTLSVGAAPAGPASTFQAIDAVAWGYLCAGNWALMLAQSEGALYGVSRDGGTVIQSKVMPNSEINATGTFLKFQPRTASVKATWALHATDLFRAATATYVTAFNDCSADVLNSSIQQRRGQSLVSVPYSQVLAAYLSESASSMVEAAEASKTLIAAAAQAKQSKGDPISTRLSVWLDRHDSRLEGASIFVPVHTGTYEPRMKPVFEMFNPSTGAYYYTANPGSPRAGFQRSTVDGTATGALTPSLGYAVAPEEGMPEPRFSAALRTYTLNPDASEIRSGQNPNLPAVCGSASCPPWTDVTTYEDIVYFYRAPHPNLELIGYALWNTTATGPKKYRWLRLGSPAGNGWALTSPNLQLYLSPYSSGSAEYPLVTTDLATPSAQNAVELMRVLRVDPRQGVLVSNSPRTLGDIRADVAQALAETYGDAYANRSVDEVLGMVGLTTKDIDTAARRLVQETNALGRGLLDDGTYTGVPTSQSKRVWGLAPMDGSTHPAVLYARTAGKSWSPPATTNTTEAYALTSVVAALDYLRDSMTNANGKFDRTGLSPGTQKTLKTAVQMAKAHLGPRTRVGYSSSAATAWPELESATFYFQGLGYPNTAQGIEQAKNEIEVWVGDGGLECARRGSIEGQPCDSLRFLKTVSSGETDWSIDSVQNELIVRVYRSQAPAGPGGTKLLRMDYPLYVVRKTPQGLSVLSGSYPASAPLAFIPPYGDWLAKNLTDFLAVDADDPADADVDCVGLKTKLALEDELTEGQTGADGIESSYAHYLASARKAADLADSLGEQLIEEGLKMDMRAESARDEVEDLCGGVINLDSIGEQACQGECDILDALKNANSSDYDSLTACLGDPSEVLTTASFGSMPLCAFRREGKAPCQGSYTSAGASNGRSMACPQLKPAQVSCSSLFPVPTVAAEKVRFEELPTLGMVPEITPEPSEDVSNPMICRELFNFAAGKPSNWKFTYTESDLAAQARKFEVDYDALGSPIVYLSGAPWLRLLKLKNGQAPEVVSNQFPCKPYDARHWRNPAKPDEPGPDLEAFCNTLGANKPLYCGFQCTGGGVQVSDMSVVDTNRRRTERLVNAVATLRHLARTSLKGVKYSIDSKDLWGADAFFVRNYEPQRIWKYDDASIPLEYRVRYSSVRDPGLMAPIVELTSLVGNAWRGTHSQNNDAYELVPEFVGPSFGSTLQYGSLGVHTGRITYKGKLPMQSSARIYCDGRCPDLGDLERQFRDFYASWWLGVGDRSRIVVDMDDMMHGWLGEFAPTLSANLYTKGELAKALNAGRLPNNLTPFPRAALDAHWPNVDPVAMRGGPDAGDITFEDAMDALELACMGEFIARDSVPPCGDLLKSPTKILGLRDYKRAQSTLECQADRAAQYASEQIVAEAPKVIIDAFKSKNVAAVFPSNQGEMAGAVADLMESLNQVFSLTASIGKMAHDSSSAVASAESQIRMLGYQYDAAVEQAAAQIAAQQTECVNAKIRALPNISISYPFGVSMDPIQTIEDALTAKSTCANAAAQQRSAAAIQKITRNEINEKVVGVLLSLQQGLYDIASQLDETHRAFLTAHARAQAGVAKIQQIRNRASRAAANALLLDNDGMGHEFNVNTVMHARFNTLQARYNAALSDAKKLAYLARRALEQKVGMDMSKITTDLQLVPAPKQWVNDLCSLTGVNYNEIRSDTGQSDTANDANGYAESYVGDYVRKLEMFLEAYSLAYPFQDANDLAVVSVRDELVGATALCDEQGWNELLYTDGASFGRPDRPDESWEGTCSVQTGRRAEVLPGGPGPFQCPTANASGPQDSTPEVCSRMGAADAMALTSVTAASCTPTDEADSEADVPQDPPMDGMAYWYAAQGCTETTPGSGVMQACTDLSGNGRTLTGASSATIVTNGIGGLPTLSVTGTVTAPRTPNATDRFTVTYVARPLGTSTVRLWRAVDTQADSTTRETWLLYDSALSLSYYMRPSSGTLLPEGNTFAASGGAPPALASAGQIVTVRADGPNGYQLFVNGKPWAGNTTAVYPMKLGSVVAQGFAAAPVLFAETTAYSRALSDAELSQLHGYLAAKYQIDVATADSWIDGDDLSRMRSSAGFVSSVSGFTGDATGIYDRASGRAITRTGGVSALTTLGGHAAIDFDGVDDFLRWNTFGYACNRSDPSQACITAPRETVGEYSVTIVARYANVAREHVLYWDGGIVRLVANGANGSVSVRVAKPTGTETYVSPTGIVGPDVPFVVTLRASESRGATDVFVNGIKRATWPGFEFEGAERFAGRLSGDYFRGAMAEILVHARDLGDTRVNALHASLGAKYGIAVTALGEGGSVASAGSPRVRQWVPVERGDSYIFSWYQPKDDAVLTPTFESGDGQTVANGAILHVLPCVNGASPATGCEAGVHPYWTRHFTTLVAPSGGWMAVGLPAPTTNDTVRLVAGTQLERIASDQSTQPAPFFPTDDDLLKPVGRCEDTDGSAFRAMWRRGCETYCPPGSGPTCSVSANGATTRCYKELNFRVMLEDIERGVLMQEAGFGLGNFNYRFDEVAFNLVGTGIKNCELSDQPSACYANNRLSYSLRHDGPFRVRNHEGNVYRAPLYAGRIQQSDALAAERVLSHPLSSNDRNLLTDLWDDELRGRPLDGNYSLRIYETDSLDWEKLEDVQLLLKYRYWTRFD